MQYIFKNILFVIIFFFLPSSERRDTCMWLLEPDHISYTQSIVSKRGLTNWANVPTPTCMWKQLFKTQHGRIAIDPVILAAIGHYFIANKKRKLKMPMRGSEATHMDTRNRRLIVGPFIENLLVFELSCGQFKRYLTNKDVVKTVQLIQPIRTMYST